MNRARAFLLIVVILTTPVLFPAAASAVPGFTLTIAPANITFPDQDPDTNPSTAATSTVTVTIDPVGMGSSQWSLYALSRGQLVAAGSSIPIANISWTATNQTTFRNGSLTTTAPGTLVARNSGNGHKVGVLSFSIQNLWTYAAGVYTQTVDFTAVSP